jgi:hypothetical protein
VMWKNGRNSSRGSGGGGGSGYVTKGGGGSRGGGMGGRNGYQGNNGNNPTRGGGRQGTGGGKSGYLGSGGGSVPGTGGGGYLGGNNGQTGGFSGRGGYSHSGVNAGGGYLGNGGGNAQGVRGGGNGSFGRNGGSIDGGRGGRGGRGDIPNSSTPNSLSVFDKLKGGNNSQPGGQQSFQGFGSQGRGGQSNFRGSGSPNTFGGGGREANQGGRFGGKSFSTPAPMGGGNGYRNGFQPALNSSQPASQGFGGFQKKSFGTGTQQPENDEMEDASNEPSGWGFAHQIAQDPEPSANSSPWAGIAGNSSQTQSGYSFHSSRPPPISTTPAVPDESIGISLSNKIVDEESDEEEKEESKKSIATADSPDSQSVEKKFIDPRFLEFLSVKNDFLGDYSPEDIMKYGIVPCIPPTPVR